MLYLVVVSAKETLHLYSEIAQSVEQVTVNHRVAGSIPAFGAKTILSKDKNESTSAKSQKRSNSL